MTDDDPNALAATALAHYQARRYDEAIAAYRQLTGLQPALAHAWYMLGTSLAAAGNTGDARQAYNEALARQPGHADSLYGLAFIAYTQHQYPEAADCFRRVLAATPANAQAHNGLASTLQAMGQYHESLQHYDTAIRLVPVYADAHYGRGSSMLVLGNTEGAMESLREALRLAPNHPGAHINMASALMNWGKADEALAHCDQVLESDPQNIDAIALAATIEQHAGKAEQAMQRLQPWIDRGVRHVNLSIAYAEVSKTLDRPEPAIRLLEDILSQGQPLPATSRRNLHFNLGRLYDKTGEYDPAFEHYRQGNALRPREFDPAINRRETDTIIQAYNPAFVAGAPRAQTLSDRPVFVVGMPRSGTSLVEQIMASHPEVFGAGELPDMWQMVAQLPGMPGITQPWPGCTQEIDQDTVNALAGRYLDRLQSLAPDARRVVDKMPGNFSFLGLIAQLFPQARIVHCVRDPVDTCLSCYFQDFSRTHAYSFDLEHLGAYYNEYRRLMAHWKDVLSIPVMDVSYEALTEDQEGVSRRLIDFIGLDWDERCLDFHRTERFVATASYDQVRRPLYRKSVARWKHYESHLGPLLETLRQAPD